ncbi:nucleoside transporter C-terminal domain-containing protein [Nodosilinea sp. P-1105]|uniref:NupC/NupG family nucleoside CNT transporter n=1 Tax=Nodosilinea sp. P-1105 TaxID=2546229 RepID=UPI00146E93DA|nr:nucleoside transporter C-terminal domain-containing protein [Nodosilinea sp. P-1105]NMF83606.1 nucleoside:proton symporter [Nodosilinea sp. P-1105]
MALRLISLLGIGGLCFIAWLGSEDRRQVPWKMILWGIGLQLVLGLLIFLVPLSRDLVVWLSGILNGLIDASDAGARFLFGPILVPDFSQPVGPSGAGRWVARALTPPFTPVPGDRLGTDNLNLGYIFAFRSLPQVVFFSAIFSLLYGLGLIQPVIRAFAQFFRWSMNISGAEALAGGANIFVGIESAIAIRPFLERMTRSELCAIMASMFGSIASTMLGLYAGYLRGTFPAIAGHLMSASVLTIPAAFVMAKILVPEQAVPETLGKVPAIDMTDGDRKSPMDSLILGALDGVKMAVGIVAALIAILGLIALLNLIFAQLATLADSDVALWRSLGQVFQVMTLQNIMGAIFLPLTFLTGVSLDWTELWISSQLIGRRLLETAIPPYIALADLAAEGAISDRALVIVSYVLCGFAHIPSVGIFVGGLSGLVPSRRQDISELSWKALWAGTLATLMTGCIAGLYFYEGTAVLGR